MLELLLRVITLIHIIFVLFVVGTPLLNSNYLLFLHSIFVPFMMIHWMCNDNTCILTIIEKKLRQEINGKFDKDECITCKIIEPVYDFRKNYSTFSKIIYTVTIVLWLLGVVKLYCKYQSGSITSFQDLFML